MCRSSIDVKQCNDIQKANVRNMTVFEAMRYNEDAIECDPISRVLSIEETIPGLAFVIIGILICDDSGEEPGRNISRTGSEILSCSIGLL